MTTLCRNETDFFVKNTGKIQPNKAGMGQVKLWFSSRRNNHLKKSKNWDKQI